MRDIAMATTWRIIAFSTTVLVVAALTWHANGTADWGSAGLTGAIAGSIKMVLYVLHNKAYRRWWNAKETKEAIVEECGAYIYNTENGVWSCTKPQYHGGLCV